MPIGAETEGLELRLIEPGTPEYAEDSRAALPDEGGVAGAFVTRSAWREGPASVRAPHAPG
jgi:hypothetical protein